ncbi:Uncharacterised protein [Nocardia farcinica]|uniref:Uncharacterized protein n=1 Tax=Nocardia farcinica TaxID=37329 RepID=A0A449H4X5_NOCFR|nr:hypothetical protein [Nocardia farcinica]MBF6312134.1 hypothetical protein [Nocardia farcinica]UEX22702.1 hypothetical protein LMJ57_27825 [Nocardia farcinica]VFA93114.1 Uncharacterised protein [Nocardia farcinica]
MSEHTISQWQQFRDQARAGELFLDDAAAAQACLDACDEFAQAYADLLVAAQRAQRVSGFGGFNIADELADLFHKQATGEPGSIDQVILDTIAVVKDMREIMQLSIDRLTEQDAVNSNQITSTAADLGAPR